MRKLIPFLIALILISTGGVAFAFLYSLDQSSGIVKTPFYGLQTWAASGSQLETISTEIPTQTIEPTATPMATENIPSFVTASPMPDNTDVPTATLTATPTASPTWTPTAIPPTSTATSGPTLMPRIQTAIAQTATASN